MYQNVGIATFLVALFCLFRGVYVAIGMNFGQIGTDGEDDYLYKVDNNDDEIESGDSSGSWFLLAGLAGLACMYMLFRSTRFLP